MSDDGREVAASALEEEASSGGSKDEALEKQLDVSGEDDEELGLSEPEPDVELSEEDEAPEVPSEESPEEEVAEESAGELEDVAETEQAEGDTVVENKVIPGAVSEEDGLEEVPVDDSSQQGGDSSKEVKVAVVAPPFKVINPNSRSSVHEELRAYENRRRTSFQAKLESSSLYWRSFRDLLQSSVHETARAERFVLGMAKANLSYANAMQASFEDGFLDGRGNVVLDEKKQKRLAEQRAEGVNVLSPKSAASATPSKPITLTAEERKANMLTTIMEAQLALAKKFGENARELEEEIASEVTNLREELQNKVNGIHNLGDVILFELERTETEVSEAWEAYYTIADKAMGGNSLRAISSKDSNSPTKAAEGGSNDVWVVEMQYRVAVAYQLSVWEKASTELSNLFATMKETEIQRRVDLREYLLAFTQRQQRLFLGLPEVYTPPLKDLVGRDIDRDSIEEKVQFSIRRRAELLQREEASTKKPAEKGSGLSGVKNNLGTSELESPLMSELLCKAKVVDRKLTGLVGGWKTTLAVVTADSFLHLFDLPPGRVHAGSAPEVAFQTLAPTVQMPSAENMKLGKTFFVRGWCDGLVPADSIALDNCKITSKGTTFELVEKSESKGASKMFRNTNTRKFVLRAVTEEEAQDWIKALEKGYI